MAYREGQYTDAIENQVKKPAWFRQSEGEARRFWETLGFDNLPPIYLLGEGDFVDRMWEYEPQMIAYVPPLVDAAMVRR